MAWGLFWSTLVGTRGLWDGLGGGVRRKHKEGRSRHRQHHQWCDSASYRRADSIFLICIISINWINVNHLVRRGQVCLKWLKLTGLRSNRDLYPPFCLVYSDESTFTLRGYMVLILSCLSLTITVCKPCTLCQSLQYAWIIIPTEIHNVTPYGISEIRADVSSIWEMHILPPPGEDQSTLDQSQVRIQSRDLLLYNPPTFLPSASFPQTLVEPRTRDSNIHPIFTRLLSLCRQIWKTEGIKR